jgi:hypothetical protein
MHTDIIRVMMEAVRISETSVYTKETTRLYTPEDYNLHIHRREDLKSHKGTFLLFKLPFFIFVIL